MRWCHEILFGILMLLGPVICLPFPASAQASKVDSERLFEELQAAHGLSNDQMESIRRIFHGSGYIGQGNPAITRHPMTPQDCREKLSHLAVQYENGQFEKICGAKYMAPLYDPKTQKAEAAPACIDQFEFPDIPCVYPVVWVRAREAAEICRAMGKRLCDAHEWEGACAGALEPPDYRFDLARDASPNVAVERMRQAHNRAYAAGKNWSYGDHYQKGTCACSSVKTPGCTGGSWTGCGSNTFPAGSFPECRSSLGVYDLHGNAAEHMNLPLAEDQMSSRGSTSLGYTEMKGSWFIFDTYYAHPDWCRWRAPFWHGSRVMDANSHHNYHLGFRCCKTLNKEGAAGQGKFR
jgi:formylglycine-generating enzyme required for sulfatase activity